MGLTLWPGSLQATGYIDYDAMEATAKLFRPKVLIAGASAYPRHYDYLYLTISIYPYMHQSIYPSIHLSINHYIYLPTYLSVYLPIDLSIYLSIYLSI